jgi:hypothetical protein
MVDLNPTEPCRMGCIPGDVSSTFAMANKPQAIRPPLLQRGHWVFSAREILAV